MANPQIEQIRQMLAENPVVAEGASLADMRKGLDAMGNMAPRLADVTTTPADLGGVPGEWFDADGADADRVVLYLHGGGYVLGSVQSHRVLLEVLAKAVNCRVAALNYRLAPEAPFPAAVDDVIAAATHIRANAGQYGMDPDKLAIGGDSAGGNLSAIVCNHFAAQGDAPLALQLLIYPATDNTIETESRRELTEGITLDRKTLDYFFEGYVGGLDVDGSDPRLNPAKAPGFTGVTPAHIVTAQYDPLRDEGKAYGDLLAAAGVAVSYRCYDGLMHNFIMQTAVVSAAKSAVDDMAAALSQAFSST